MTSTAATTFAEDLFSAKVIAAGAVSAVAHQRPVFERDPSAELAADPEARRDVFADIRWPEVTVPVAWVEQFHSDVLDSEGSDADRFTDPLVRPHGGSRRGSHGESSDALADLRSAHAEMVVAIERFSRAAAGSGLALAGDEEVAGFLLEGEFASRRLEAAQADVAARFNGCSLWGIEGFRSARDWLRSHASTSPGDAARVFDAAGWMIRHPQMAQLWREGSVTRRHVDILARAHAMFPRLSASLSEIEADIAAAAADLSPKSFERTLMRTLHRIDPDAVDEANAKRRKDDTYFRASTLLDGHVRVDGLLPPEIGQLLINQLASARDKDRDRRAAAAQEAKCQCAPGRPICVAGPCVTAAIVVCDHQPDSICMLDECVVARRLQANATLPPVEQGQRPPSDGTPSLSQRNVDALGLILDAAASAHGDARLPDTGGERPVVHITADIETISNAGANGGGQGWIESLTGTKVTPITAEATRRLSCDAIVELALLDVRGHLNAISARRRVIPNRMRRVILVRDDGRCRFPGCVTSIREVHHIRHWGEGGFTTHDNLIGLCSHHHHLIHEGGWRISGDPNDIVDFINPHGRSWQSRPPTRQ